MAEGRREDEGKQKSSTSAPGPGVSNYSSLEVKGYPLTTPNRGPWKRCVFMMFGVVIGYWMISASCNRELYFGFMPLGHIHEEEF